MRGLIFGIVGLLLASPVFCQVDTLMLVEIGSIEAPAEITDLYIEDLDGDSLKEIILTTAANIHIYNGITYEPIWTSPELANPQDLLFEDINLDGLIDFSVKDTTNIYLIDPHNDVVIWTSPPIDSTYSCYTIGDRNDDDWVDALIVNQVPTDTTTDFDTVWVSVFDGPSFQQLHQFYELLPRYDRWEGMIHRGEHEYPKRIIVRKISDGSQLRSFLFIFSNYGSFYYEPTVNASRGSGNIRIYEGNVLYLRYIQQIGGLRNHIIINEDETVLLYSINYFDVSTNNYISGAIMVNRCLPDTTLSTTLWSYWDSWFPQWHFRNLTIGDANFANSGAEICYGVGAWEGSGDDDSLYLKTLPDLTLLWNSSGLTYLTRVLSIFNSSFFQNIPHVICGMSYPLIEYTFFSGADGSLSAVLSDFNYLISRITDIDADGNDEILSLGESVLYIYGLQRTGVEDESVLPDRPFLLSNYPNPFNSTTTIEYGLREAGRVTIQIYDLLGRKVETLMDDKQEAGTYQVVWDAGDRSSGVYFYRISSGEFTGTRRMVLLK